ncbi:MAG: DNA repair protein RecO [Endomicrobia bacterium]|nr:DNA repair protein RecO [Endomicrobiia bacterium]
MYYLIKGLVLNARTHGENNKLITLYSYEWGKVQAIVPGAKKIGAKLSSATEPITQSEFMVFQNHPSMRPKVTGARIIENYTAVKTDFKRNVYALYAAEISDKLAPFNLEHAEKYELIARIWEVLGKCEHPRRAVTAFMLRFLKLSGYGFADYLKNSAVSLDKHIENAVKKLSACSGDDVDGIRGFDDDKIWSYVENYALNYIKPPSVGIFLRKIEAEV